MVGTRSWVVTPSLADIRAVMNEVGATNTVLSIYFRQPWVLQIRLACT
jgi:beta-glucosidase